MIVVLDYGAGNLQSVVKAFRFLGCDAAVTSDPGELQWADAAVLPGVGAFGDAMAALRHSGLVAPMLNFIGSGRPFLGICLGMQVLFEGSDEAPGIPGLGVLRGTASRIPEAPGLKIPHIGWNSLNLTDREGLFEGLDEHPYVYFVHSYSLGAADRGVVTATARYGVTIDAAVQRGNLFATQFHPEKSGRAGLQMLRNFARTIGKENSPCMQNGLSRASTSTADGLLKASRS
jgi:glutamine amidotransferase